MLKKCQVCDDLVIHPSEIVFSIQGELNGVMAEITGKILMSTLEHINHGAVGDVEDLFEAIKPNIKASAERLWKSDKTTHIEFDAAELR